MKGASKKKKANVAKKKGQKKSVVHNAIVVDPQQYFQVFVEQPGEGGNSILAPQTGLVEEHVARAEAESLKLLGVAGFILKMDGTPDGCKVEKWAAVATVIEAKKLEEALNN